MQRFKYTIHNMIGHPLMEIFSLVGLHKLADWVHDVTLPNNMPHDDIAREIKKALDQKEYETIDIGLYD